MTPDQMEALRQVWRQRFSQLAEPLLEPFGLSEAQRIREKADAIELDRIRAEVAKEGPPPPKRRNPLWAWRKRMRGW
jgi:hypothetical protein